MVVSNLASLKTKLLVVTRPALSPVSPALSDDGSILQVPEARNLGVTLTPVFTQPHIKSDFSFSTSSTPCHTRRCHHGAGQHHRPLPGPLP